MDDSTGYAVLTKCFIGELRRKPSQAGRMIVVVK